MKETAQSINNDSGTEIMGELIFIYIFFLQHNIYYAIHHIHLCIYMFL